MGPKEQVLGPSDGRLTHPAGSALSVGTTEIQLKGRAVSVPSIRVDGRTVVSIGRWLKTAIVWDEDLIEGETLQDPSSFAAVLKKSGLKTDIFTFGQRLPDVVPHYAYHLEWDSFAAIPIISYLDWWENCAKYDVRSAVKKSAKRGIVTREVALDDQFIEGVVGIYNENPLRQGKHFWHYNKDFATVKRMTCTYLDRSILIGAYYEDELVGFIKMVRVGNIAYTFNVISMTKHFRKKPTNALIAKAVEICAARGMSHLVYGKFAVGDPGSSLMEFKRRNGFREMLVPRYYIPLTVKGELSLKAKLNHGLKERLPQSIYGLFLRGRSVMLGARRMVDR